jgi:hypothetical protein
VRQIEFSIVRYVPNVVSGDRINIGIVVIERDEEQILFADARFVCNEDRILAFDADADVEMIQGICRDIRRGLHDVEGRELFLQSMAETFSNSIQLSDLRTQTTADPAAEVDILARLYLVPNLMSTPLGR